MKKSEQTAALIAAALLFWVLYGKAWSEQAAFEKQMAAKGTK